MTPDMGRGATPPGDAPSTISSPHQATGTAQGNSLAGRLWDNVETAVPSRVVEGDLAAVLDEVFSGHAAPREFPEFLNLEDDPNLAGLFYRRRVNWIAGPTEVGKTWVACTLAASALANERDVAYIDCEPDSDLAAIVKRLRALGVPRTDIRDGFTYRHPYTGPEWNGTVGELLANGYDAVVIDGVLEAVRLTGGSNKEIDDLADWVRTGPAHLAREIDAAVLCVDHTARDGGIAGSVHKLRTVGGAAYTLEAERSIGPGRRGVIALRVAKDRNAGLNARTGQIAGRLVLDSTAGDGLIDWHAVRNAASARPSATESAEPTPAKVSPPAERPEELMGAVARALEVAGEPLSSNKVLGAVTGTATNVRWALALLVDEGHVARDEVRGRGKHPTHLHRFLKPYPPGAPRAAAASPPPLRGVGGGTTHAATATPTQGPTQVDAPPTHSTQGASEDHDAPPTHPHRPTHLSAVAR